MGWSEWQDPYRVDLAGNVEFYTWDTVNGDGPSGDVDQNSFKYGESRDALEVQVVTSGAIWSAPAAWATYREKYPPALDVLEQGVDFDVIPGKNSWDDDAFVEWAADPNTWAGWGSPPQSGYVTTSPNPDVEPWEGAGSITLAVAGGAEQTWATWTAHEPGEPIPPMPDPGNVDSFTVRAHYTISQGGQGSAFATFVRPYMRLTLPAYRYWIPEAVRPLPLRQRQRDDGEALSTKRWRRGRSRQASNRWRGYR